MTDLARAVLTQTALFFHLIGFASLFGVAVVQVRAQVRVARNGMMHGALTQLISGLVLAALMKNSLNPDALGAKLGIVLIIIVILAFYRRKTERIIPPLPFFTVFGLTLLEVIIALVWLPLH